TPRSPSTFTTTPLAIIHCPTRCRDVVLSAPEVHLAARPLGLSAARATRLGTHDQRRAKPVRTARHAQPPGCAWACVFRCWLGAAGQQRGGPSLPEATARPR